MSQLTNMWVKAGDDVPDKRSVLRKVEMYSPQLNLMVVVVVIMMVVMVTAQAVLAPNILSAVDLMFPTPRKAHCRSHIEGAYATPIAATPRARLPSRNLPSNCPFFHAPSLAVIRNRAAVGTSSTTAPATL